MLKRIIILLTAGFLVSFLLFVVIKGTANKPKVFLEKSDSTQRLTMPYIEVEKPESEVDKNESRESEFSELLAYLEEFNIPKKIKDDLEASIEKSGLDKDWDNRIVSREKLQEAGLEPSQLAKSGLDKTVRNISAGRKVSNETFDKAIQVFLSEPAAESGQMKDLQSEALVDLAFSAFENFKLARAEKAFKVVIENYPESNSAPMAYLEYARLLFEQGRLSEARSLISEAVNKYSADKEFVSLAEKLEETIDSYE